MTFPDDFSGRPAARDRCRVCNADLNGPAPLQGDAFCNAPLCRTRARVAHSGRIGAERDRLGALRRRQARDRARPLQAAAVAAAGLEATVPLALGVAPHITLGVGPRPPDREAAFAAHLDRIVAAAFDPAAPPEQVHLPEPARRLAEERPDPPAVAAACIACRGLCCLRGAANDAFLSAGTMVWQRRRRPEATPEALRLAYLAHLPDESVEGSCVYHDPRGCALPRTLRSDVCNGWECEERADLAREVRVTGAAAAVVVGLPRGHHERPAAGALPVRVVAVAADGRVTVDDGATVPALDPDAD